MHTILFRPVRNTRTALFAVALLAVVGVMLMGCGSPTVSNVTVVQLESNGDGCSPDEFTTQQGFIVKLTLKNTGTRDVTFSFPTAPYSFTAAAGQTALGNFTAPTKTGSYDYECGAAGSTNKGTIQVRNSQ